ncbi:MAG: DNA polymerase III subunit beta, partial [Magnetococcales bacterium]|nr:DNA polymerase III subunit beta [Magnetococcales bacterium]
LPAFQEEAKEVIVPRKAVLEARKILEESDEPVTVAIGDNYIQFIRPDITMVSKLVNGRFPNYNRVLPPVDAGTPMLVNKDDLLAMVKRMTVLSNEKSRGILLSIKGGELSIDTTNPEQEAADEKLGVDYDGDTMKIGFNARYLYEIIASIEADEICFRLRGEKFPVLITDAKRDRFLFVLMPMRV